MKRVILTKGLPASGKTTWAKELIAKESGKWKRINKDDLRAMLDGGKWSRANEAFILEARDAFILSSLKAGFNVIVDDTNLHSKHKNHIWKLVADLAVVEEKDFTDVSLEECIKRDQKRSHYVGEKVIRQMYNQFLRPAPQEYSPDAALSSAIVCDLDGTLALFGDANPYDRDFSQDKPNLVLCSILQHYWDAKFKIIIVSGRSGKFMDQTTDWLQHWSIPYSYLHMRAEGDNRKDSIVKKEIYDGSIKGFYNVEFVLDDRDQVVEFWRSQGLTCLQVAEGDF